MQNTYKNIVETLRGDTNYTKTQIGLVGQICDHLQSKTAKANYLLNLLAQNQFSAEQMKTCLKVFTDKFPGKIINGQAANRENSEISPEENLLISDYNRLIISNCMAELLYKYEIEAEVKKKEVMSSRFQLFVNQIPFLIKYKTGNENDRKIIQKRKAVELYSNLIAKLVLKPLKRIFTTPGKIKLENFIRTVNVKGQHFVDMTSEMERAGYIALNMKENELIFQVNKINQDQGAFDEILNRATRFLENADEVKQRIKLTLDRSVELASGELTHSLYKEIVDRNILLKYDDLTFKNHPPSEMDMAKIYEEILLMLNYFKKYEKVHLDKLDERIVKYSDQLCSHLIELSEKNKISKENFPYLYKSLACFSLFPGRAIKEVHAFYKDRNSIEYDIFRSKLVEAYG